VLTLLEVAADNMDIQFVFAGDGPLETAVRDAARKNGNVIATGRMNNERLPACYSAADILCVPSQYEEGFGRIILEALSCGCPVVAANRGGIPEAMDSTVGILLDPEEENISRAVKDLKLNSAHLEKLRSNCRCFAEERYSTANANSIVASYLLPSP
jgi:glycosyltransferase involved in cell wall biosynthesis